MISRSKIVISSRVRGYGIAVLLCTETTQKIYRGGAEVDFFSRSRYCNKNYGYPSTSDEGYFFSGTVDNYEFYPLEITIPENFIEFRGFFRDWQSVDCVILFFLPAHLYRICIMSNLMEHDKEFLSVRFRESDYGVLAVGLLHNPLLALEKKNASSFIDIFLIISNVKEIPSNSLLADKVTGKNIYRIQWAVGHQYSKKPTS